MFLRGLATIKLMIKLIYAWSRNYEVRRVIQPHSHSFYEFVYYIKGSGKTKIGDQEYLFNDGSFVLLPPYILHDERHDGRTSLYVIGFTFNEEFPLFFSNQENIEISRLIKNIMKEQTNKDVYYDKIIEANIKEILVCIQREKAISKRKPYIDAINRAVKFIDEYYLTKIDLNELAKNVGYCSDRFRIVFKKQIGQNPKDYILTKKLNEAKRLLVETDESIENISNRLGFNYCSRFSAFFKSKTGLYPSEYRQKLFG